jgi:hypothetical protein
MRAGAIFVDRNADGRRQSGERTFVGDGGVGRMAEEPDNLVLQLLRGIRTTLDEYSSRFDAIEGVLKEVRLTAASHDLRFDALEERLETIREGTVSAIGLAANVGRAHVDLRRQIADLTRRVERLEASR